MSYDFHRWRTKRRTSTEPLSLPSTHQMPETSVVSKFQPQTLQGQGPTTISCRPILQDKKSLRPSSNLQRKGQSRSTSCRTLRYPGPKTTTCLNTKAHPRVSSQEARPTTSWCSREQYRNSKRSSSSPLKRLALLPRSLRPRPRWTITRTLGRALTK